MIVTVDRGSAAVRCTWHRSWRWPWSSAWGCGSRRGRSARGRARSTTSCEVATSCRALVGSLAVRVGALAGAAVVVMDLTSAGLRRTAESMDEDRRPRSASGGRAPTAASIARRRLRGDTDARTRLRRGPVHPGVRPPRVVREDVLRDRGCAVAGRRAADRRCQVGDLRGLPRCARGWGRTYLRRASWSTSSSAARSRNARRWSTWCWRCRSRSPDRTSSTSSTATRSASTSSTSSRRSARSWCASTRRATGR